jgi:hypothetical protein
LSTDRFDFDQRNDQTTFVLSGGAGKDSAIDFNLSQGDTQDGTIP